MIPLDVLPKFLQYVTYIITLRHSRYTFKWL
ncbi:MAG: hypothetical protein ACOX26_00565 [Bacilli bacterium]